MKCHCGNPSEYSECCELLHKGQPAQSAEQLLRSRYSAFVTQDIAFIKQTIHPSQLHEFDEKGIREWAENSEWEGLEIHSVNEISEIETHIDFTAVYKLANQVHQHREMSVFKKKDGVWYFFDGRFINAGPVKRAEPKVGRNDPCVCGSGKKYKKCCGVND